MTQNPTPDIQTLRQEINQIDEQVVSLFVRRMAISAQVADYKKQHDLPILDASRERELLTRISELAGPELENYCRVLYTTLMGVSKSYQHKHLGFDTGVYQKIRHAIDHTPSIFPERAAVVCQGVEGAYSQMAAERLFTLPDISFVDQFEQVFEAIESGKARYGVLPLENSTAGSVTKIYDLMAKHRFYIVRAARLKVDHNLMARPGASLDSIREVLSHEQAIQQCSAFLKEHPEIKVTVCANTAMAARQVAESGRDDVAALSSRFCAQLYGLNVLTPSIQDKSNNYTRFICISKEPEIYPGADKTSLMMVTPHKPGALFQVLSRFYAQGVNLSKLESRPLPDRDFEFMFYFDLDSSVYSDQLASLLAELEAQSDEFRYLGSYSEII